MNKTIAIITPCFNENVTIIKFLEELESVLCKLSFKFKIIVVDDASTDNTQELLRNFRPKSENLKLTVLNLKFNVGHQQAIYQGLLYAQKLTSDKFIIMDSDGEDDPHAICELLKCEDHDIVHVSRGKRRESISFKIFYKFYKMIFKIVTGKNIDFGNYCMINRKTLDIIIYNSFIHFAAYLSKQQVKRSKIIFDRKKRIDGRSKMNLSSLIYHAFKAFIEYAEDFIKVFLGMFVIIFIIFLGMITFVIFQKLFTDNAILGWASVLCIGLFNTAIICLGFFSIGILLLNILTKRNKKTDDSIYEKMEQND